MAEQEKALTHYAEMDRQIKLEKSHAEMLALLEAITPHIAMYAYAGSKEPIYAAIANAKALTSMVPA